MLNDEWKKIVVDGNRLEEFTAISAMSQYKIQPNLEILEGCSYMCPGCFVKRKGNWSPYSVHLFWELANELIGREDVVLDDLVIGPTDFYGAENLETIIEDVKLSEGVMLMPEDNRNVQHNCSILGSLSEKDIEAKIRKIEKSLLGSVVKSWDVQVALDVKSLLYDKKYRQALDDRIKTFEESSLNYEISMATNIVDGVEEIIYDAIDLVREEYQTVIEILPSVVRSFHHGSKHGDKLFEWNRMLTKLSLNEKRFKTKFHFLQGDVSHKAFHYSVINIHNGRMFMAPFIYENAQIHNDAFLIDTDKGGDIIDRILEYKDWIVNYQIENSQMTECHTCKYLNICSQRLVPRIMETVFKNRKECILNKEVIQLFDNEVYYGNSY
tara:strand:- start:9088 stop:10233 length:1146 start_codon:yes stop_codon:yes gene_type:complete